MPQQITIPSDFAELGELLQRYAGEPAGRRFIELVQAGRAWSPRWPRRLLAYADKHRLEVRGTPRLVVVALVGFAGLQRWRHLRDAIAELRHARGEKSEMIYADGRDLLVFSDEPRPRYGAPESWLRPSLHASPVGPMPAVDSPAPPPAAPAPAPVTPGAPAARPPFGFITR